MNGFTIQMTDFPFVCVIVDDASTDGEQGVIMNYISHNFNLGNNPFVRNRENDDYKMTFAQHKTNKNCFFAVYSLKYNHHSIKKSKMEYLSEFLDHVKYHAVCEGDDYWIDSLKLQKQVDALERNIECSIAYCRVQKIRKDGSIINGELIPRYNHFTEGVISLKDYCKEEFNNGYWCFHTSSFMLRKESTKVTAGKDVFFEKFPYGDMPTQLWCLLHGKGYFVNDIGSCYRVLSGGYNSFILQHKDFAICQEEKLIKALEYFDKISAYKYTKDVQIRVLRARMLIDDLRGSRFSLYRYRYWPIAYRKRFKEHLSYIVMNLSPSLYYKIKSLKKKY